MELPLTDRRERVRLFECAAGESLPSLLVANGS